MSGASSTAGGIPGPTGRGMPATPRANTGTIPTVAIGSGMISPANNFVLPSTGQLTGLSFRFLFEVWQAANAQLLQIDTITANIATLQGQVATLQGQLTALQGQVSTNAANISTLQGQMTTANANIANLQSTATSLQDQINTINTRLANAGIP